MKIYESEAIEMKENEILTVAKKLAYNYCKRMYNRSGLDLYRQLMHGDNLDYSLEDMVQDIALAIIEWGYLGYKGTAENKYYMVSKKGTAENKYYMVSKKVNYRDVMKVVNNRVYQLRRNSNHKSLYIDIDGEEVCITDVLGMVKALDDDTRWYTLMLYDSMIDGLSTSVYDSRGLVNADALKIYGYQRIIEGRAIKDCDYSYCDQWLKRHRDIFDI